MKKILVCSILVLVMFGCTSKNTIDEGKQLSQDIKEPIKQEQSKQDNKEQNNEEAEIKDYDNELGLGINNNNFPDQYFKIFVLNNYDLDKNNYLSQDEIDVVIEFPGLFKKDKNLKRIVDLEGINYFKNLEKIGDYEDELLMNLEKININELINLKEIALFTCKLKELNLTNNTNLNKLCISDTYIETLALCSNAESMFLSLQSPIETSLSVDISNCNFFNDPLNAFNYLHIQNNSNDINGPIKVVKDGNIIMYTPDESANGSVILDDTGDVNALVSSSIYYLGKGNINIENNKLFDSVEEAYKYGLSGNSWFYLETTTSFDDKGCFVCGSPECKDICKPNIQCFVKLAEQPY